MTITTEAELDEATARAYQIMQLDIEDGTPEYAELNGLTLAIEIYERKHYPLDNDQPES